jgi:hypothetical protein
MKIEFNASIANSSTAVKFDGTDGNARLMLDVPATEIPEMVKIPAYFLGKNLKVTIELEEE